MEEFVHILELLKVPNLVKNELFHLFNEINNSNNETDIQLPYLSETTIEYLHDNLKLLPYPTSILIQKLLCLWNPHFKETDNVLQTLYLTTISELIVEIENNEIESRSLNKLLSLLSQVVLDDSKIDEFNETLLPKIFDCVANGTINKNDLYLSLVPQRKLQLLGSFSKLENTNRIKNLNDHEYIFLNCIENKQHWLLDMIEAYSPDNSLPKIPEMVLEKIPFLKLVLLADSENITLEKIVVIERILSSENMKKMAENDRFVKSFSAELEREFKIIKFCMENSAQKNLNLNIVYETVKTNSCLSTLIRFIDVSVIEKREQIKLLLYENNRLLREFHMAKMNIDIMGDKAWDVIIFEGYSIITDVINIIMMTEINSPELYFNKVTQHLNDLKIKLIEFQSKNIQIELLENIFALIFLRYEYFIEDESENSAESFPKLQTSSPARDSKVYKTYGFVCNDLVLRDILSMLKVVVLESKVKIFEEIKKTLEGNKALQELKIRFETIYKNVADALWRLQLLTPPSFYNDIGAFGDKPKTTYCKCEEVTGNGTYHEFIKEISSDSDTESIKKPCVNNKGTAELISNNNNEMGEKQVNDVSDTVKSDGKRKMRKKKNRRSETEKSSGSETTASSNKSRRKLQRGSSSDYPKESSHLLNYMLASPESLIYLCLSQENFVKVAQVLKMYKMEKSNLATDIRFTEKLLKLRKELSEFFQRSIKSRTVVDIETDCTPIENIRRISDLVHDSTHVINLTENFFSTNFILENKEFQILIHQFSSTYPFLKNYSISNETFMNIFDLALTLGKNYEHSETLLKCACRHESSFDENSNYRIFYENILRCFNEINSRMTPDESHVSVVHILNNYRYSIDPKMAIRKISFERNLTEDLRYFYEELNINSLDQSVAIHPSHKTYLKILLSFSDLHKKTSRNYMGRFFSYLKIFSHLFKEQYINDGLPKINSYFDILSLRRSDVVAKLVIELEKINPLELEDIFMKMKLDLVYHLMINCFPKIAPISFDTSDDDEIRDISNLEDLVDRLTEDSEINQSVNSLYHPNEKTLTYIYKNNWVLAYILTLMYPKNKTKKSLDFNSNKTFCFDNLLELKRISVLKVLYKNKAIVAALQHYVPSNMLYSYIKSLFDGEAGFKIIGTEIVKSIYEVLEYLPEKQIKNDKKLIKLRDLVLFHLTNDANIEKSYKYSQNIKNMSLRVKCVLDNLYRWKGDICLDVLKDLLTSFDARPNNFETAELIEWVKKIEIYEEICVNTDYESWYEVYELSEVPQPTTEFEGYYEISEQFKYDPTSLFKNLIELKLANISLKWLDLHQVKKDIMHLIDADYMKLIFEESFADLSTIENILNQLTLVQSVSLCKTLMKTLQNLKHLKFLVNYVIKKDTKNINSYRNIQIGIEIAYCMNSFEYDQILNIIDRPILIVEQLIMNTRLEKLAIVLNVIKDTLRGLEPKDLTENTIGIEKIDELLRIYAEKSLDFRVNIQAQSSTISSESKSSEEKLLQSIDSASLELSKQTFLMPNDIPDKSQWVQNSEATKCMCCCTTVFSMFNRRHHCRRCGRVVCGTCSMKRLIVPTYDDVLVRVCNDCYDSMTCQQPIINVPAKSDKMSSIHSDSEFLVDYWQLTDDPMHNATVREEFSYEYAPSVSLCLSILKLHSVNENYAKFLLSQCESMMKLIQPVMPGKINYEIDYNMLIQMLRSLLVAAKVGCARCSLESGLIHCDHLLGQIDLLTMLANNDCLELLPHITQFKGIQANVSKYKNITSQPFQMGEALGSLGIRKLRDKLMENEQWHLALEVSTKAGLDKTGVFAAWGKTCLKAGCLQQAREKFQNCLERNTLSEEESIKSEPNISNPTMAKLRHVGSKLSLSSTGSFNRPLKNPSLVNDIVEILESLSYKLDPIVVRNAESARSNSFKKMPNSTAVGLSPSDPAVVILNKLANLKNIAQGNIGALYPEGQQIPQKISLSHKNERKNISTKMFMEKCYFDECIYYLKNYGSHSALIQFYLKHEYIREALKCIIDNNFDTELYVEVYVTCLKNGCIDELQNFFTELDSTLETWKVGLTNICRHLEQTGLLHTLYQLQVWMGDNVRAAMTCIKFYQCESSTYSDLYANLEHLHTAQAHLKQELENDQWVQIEQPGRRMSSNSQDYSKPLVYKMDPREIDKHINTIWRQVEITKFLASCERSGKQTLQILPEIFPYKEDLANDVNKTYTIPTLFGTKIEKVQLTVLAIISGRNVEEGFGIAFRIIQDYHLNSTKVYCIVAKYLSLVKRYSDIEKLVSCIDTSGISEQTSVQICDELLALAVRTVSNLDTSGSQKQDVSYIESLIKLIKDVGTKITAYIESKQLKAAYLLAVRHDRMRDVRRVLREAERLNQPHIRNICLKRLMQSSPQKT